MAVIAGNWKMHMAPEEVRTFFSAFEIDTGLFASVGISLAILSTCG